MIKFRQKEFTSTSFSKLGQSFKRGINGVTSQAKSVGTNIKELRSQVRTTIGNKVNTSRSALNALKSGQVRADNIVRHMNSGNNPTVNLVDNIARGARVGAGVAGAGALAAGIIGGGGDLDSIKSGLMDASNIATVAAPTLGYLSSSNVIKKILPRVSNRNYNPQRAKVFKDSHLYRNMAKKNGWRNVIPNLFLSKNQVNDLSKVALGTDLSKTVDTSAKGSTLINAVGSTVKSLARK